MELAVLTTHRTRMELSTSTSPFAEESISTGLSGVTKRSTTTCFRLSASACGVRIRMRRFIGSPVLYAGVDPRIIVRRMIAQLRRMWGWPPHGDASGGGGGPGDGVQRHAEAKAEHRSGDYLCLQKAPSQQRCHGHDGAMGCGAQLSGGCSAVALGDTHYREPTALGSRKGYKISP